jgi:hypothetical protein
MNIRSSGGPSARLLATAKARLRAVHFDTARPLAMPRSGAAAVAGAFNEDFPPGVLEKCCRTRRNLFDFIVVDGTQ